MTDSDCALDRPRQMGEVVWCAMDLAHRERHANVGVQGMEGEHGGHKPGSQLTDDANETELFASSLRGRSAGRR